MTKSFLILIRWIIGLCFGSFLNVVIDRLPEKRTLVKGRSVCEFCGHPLSARDLIPIVSWIMLKGRCRYCGEKISFRYCAAEFLGGVAAVTAYLIYKNIFQQCFAFLTILILIAIAFIDGEHMIIPNELNLALLCCALIAFWLFPQILITERLIGSVVIALPMLMITILMKGFGWGDVKMTAAAGLFLGRRRIIAAFIIAVLLGGAVAVIKRLLGKAEEKMAFGPMLSIGCVTAMLFGDRIIQLYLNFLMSIVNLLN